MDNEYFEYFEYRKRVLTSYFWRFVAVANIGIAVATWPIKGGLSVFNMYKIRKEVEHNDTDNLMINISKLIPTGLNRELMLYFKYCGQNLTAEDIYKILANVRLYSKNNMKNSEVYELVLEYLRGGSDSKKYLYIIQNFIGSDDILKDALMYPDSLSLKLKEKYGDDFFNKLNIWVESLDTHSAKINLFKSENNLYDVYPANDIETVLLKPYSYAEYSSFLNEEDDIHYKYHCGLEDRINDTYHISVYDKYFSGQSFAIPNTKNPYELIEEMITTQGKNNIIAMLQERSTFDGTFNLRNERDDYRNYETLTLDLLSIIDSEAVTLKENETYEEYFKKLEESFPTLDIYRFNSLLIDKDGKYDYNIYKIFMPLYLEKLSKEEIITEDDIQMYTEIYIIFYRESVWQIDDEFEKVVSSYLNPLKAQFDDELKNILRAKNEEDLISLIEDTSSYKLKLISNKQQ